MEKDEGDFSFSGLKTSVLRRLQDMFGAAYGTGRPGSFHPLASPATLRAAEGEIRVVAAAFQDAVVDVLVHKGLRCAAKHGVNQLVVCGGVAANGALRDRMIAEGRVRGIEAIFPSIRLCTDNAAMIAARADTLLSRGISDDLGFPAMSRW